MLPIPVAIALAQLKVRRKQSIAAALGVMVGVGFFIVVSGQMNGFQNFLRTQLIEAYPHITITDEFRQPAPQPLILAYPDAAVEVRRQLPKDPVRGINNAQALLATLQARSDLTASTVLRGQLLLRRSGRDYPVSALGIVPAEEQRVTDIRKDIIAGSLEALSAVPDGVIIGRVLAEKMEAQLGDTVNALTREGATQLRVVGIFASGIESLDASQVYVALTKQQAMQGRPRIINEIRVRLKDFSMTRPIAEQLEHQFAYKAAPWEETNQRVLSIFLFQNITIFSTLTAILLVAGFGIYNVISTIVMEKSRDIAILRSIGLPRRQVVLIFMLQGVVLAALGAMLGCLLAHFAAEFMRTLPAPGGGRLADGSLRTLPVLTEPWRFVMASLAASIVALFAAWLPARRAARANPLEIIRGMA